MVVVRIDGVDGDMGVNGLYRSKSRSRGKSKSGFTGSGSGSGSSRCRCRGLLDYVSCV